MTPDKLRTLSWRTFKATIVCGVIGILLVISIPNPSYRDTADLAVRILATLGFGVVGIAMLTNLVSLVSGAVAWIKGTRHCGWILICAILLLIPVVLVVAFWLNI